MPKPKKDWKQHQFTAIIINNVNLFFLSKIISVNASKTDTDVFTAIILRCSRWNLLIFIMLSSCSIFLFKNFGKIKKTLKNVKFDENKKLKNVFTSMVDSAILTLASVTRLSFWLCAAVFLPQSHSLSVHLNEGCLYKEDIHPIRYLIW